MGIKTLVEARQILVLAFGEEKAKPAFQMLYARDDSYVPAAFPADPAGGDGVAGRGREAAL